MINCSYVTDSRKVFATIAATTCGGQSLRYLRDNFSQLEVATEKVVPGFSTSDGKAGRVRSSRFGWSDHFALPDGGAHTALGCARAWGHLRPFVKHTKAHLVRAMMEGVTFAMYDSFSIIRDHCPTINLPIVLNEGGAKNRLWRRMITDIFNVPTVFVKSRIGAPMGDAILAGVATGIFKDFGIAKEKAEHIDRMDPIPANHDRYMDYHQLYRRLYSHLQEDFVTRARLREQHQPLSR